MRVLLVGGSKSGKSMLAQELCRRLAGDKPLIYWATMIPADGEDRQRIANHRIEREGWGFTTLECPKNLLSAASLVPPDATVLFDSVTAVLANEMFGGEYRENAPADTAQELLTLSRCCENFILVSDDVFRDGTRYDDMTEDYRRGLAQVCRSVAAEFEAVYEVTAGVPKVWKGAPL